MSPTTRSSSPTAPSATTGNILDILGEQNIDRRHRSGLSGLCRHQRDGRARTGAANEAGAYAGLIYLRGTAENDFVADIPQERADIVYLCSPNNPTGAVATRAQLKRG